MDYLNTDKARRQKILLLTGYVLIAIMVVLSTLILVYITEGYRISKNGVIQNGLVFFDSQPNPANIYVNNKLEPSTTNTSFLLPSGLYNIKITAKGYMSWRRQIQVIGGTVQTYDYPFLFPRKLITHSIDVFSAQPQFVSQSPSHQYMMVESTNTPTNFDIFNLTSPASAPQIISVPSNVLYPNLMPTTISNQSWQLVQWSTDNQNVLLQYSFNQTSEFILVNINNPAKSVNLSQLFQTYNFNSISLVNNQYNLYDLYNTNTKVLDQVSLNSPLVINSVLTQVLAYKTYSTNTTLYVTTLNAPNGTALVEEEVGSTNYFIQKVALASSYLLDLTDYNDVQYVVVGQNNKPDINIYQDPVNQIINDPTQKPFPVQVLRINDPNYLSFSDNAQFIMVENGSHFAVYNERSGLAYNYIVPYSLQAPQTHATWMDGDRIVYITNNHLLVFDFNDQNLHILEPADSQYLPFFDVNYQYIYTIVNKKGLGYLTQTATFVP